MKIPSKSSTSTFETTQANLLGLDYVMTVVGCRLQSSTLGSAYSDTATTCSRQSVCDVVNSIANVLSVSSFSYTAPTALGIKQVAEQIKANVFIPRF